MSERLTLFAQVLLPLPVPKSYTYRVLEEWNEMLEIGQRVVVQFGPRKIYAGIILDFTDMPPEKYAASYILEILDDEPVVSPMQLKFWQWVSTYYMCHLGEVMASALPAGFRLQSESTIVLSPEYDEEVSQELDEKEWEILAALLKKKVLRLDEAAAISGLRSPMKYIKSLYARGIILMQEEVKENYKPKIEVFLQLTPAWSDESFAETELGKLEKKAPKQATVIMAMLGMGKGEFPKKKLIEAYGVEASHIKALEKKGFILQLQRAVPRFQKPGDGQDTFELSAAQKEIVSEIKIQFELQKNVLLHGITGSGKTFVYQQLIQDNLQAGKQVLYLVPEVGLTEQLVVRLAAFFGDKMGVWHNYYSSNERTELYQQIKNGEIQLLVGARSALFAPFQKLGLVVVDEEHENSYKQFDKRPHYHGRDAAMQLAAMHKCPVLLGSATPSYEMLHNCEEGKMHLVRLQRRFMETPEPEIDVLHVGEAKRQNRMKELFSVVMLEEIQRTLDSKGQVIVFQNRKGYVPFISCDFCGYTAHCANCDIALTYYKSLHTQKCNYCGYTQDPPSECPACGSTALSMRGFGTERIAEELTLFFPEARITRFDNESIRKRSDFQRILQGFENKQIDILVGTQLLSKGLDFENVGLVAVPDADMLINIPDFRSHERAFQQLHQVAGRSGRGSKRGKVLIQSYQAAHPVLKAVVENDFYGLAGQETEMRKALDYPPFTRLIKITIRHKDPNVAQAAANAYGNTIRKALQERVLGPQAPVVGKIRNYYLQQLMVKMQPHKDDISGIKRFLTDASLVLYKTQGLKGVWVDFDVDPV